MRSFVFLLIFFGLVACSQGGNQTYQFYDTHAYAYFLERLNQSGAGYSEAGNMSITYSSSQHEKVMAAVNSVMAHYYPDCGGSFQDARRQKALKSSLKSRHVPYRSVMMDTGEKLVCDPGYTDKFNSVYRSVLRRYR